MLQPDETKNLPVEMPPIWASGILTEEFVLRQVLQTREERMRQLGEEYGRSLPSEQFKPNVAKKPNG